jgi:Holliday junction resolvase RusA-like endonuclease
MTVASGDVDLGVIPRQDVICMLRIPGEPVPKARPRLGRGNAIYTPDTTIAQERRIANYLKVTYPRLEPYDGGVGLLVRCSFTGKGRGDWDNLGKLCSDALNRKAYLDDRQVRRAQVELLSLQPEASTIVVVYRL